MFRKSFTEYSARGQKNYLKRIRESSADNETTEFNLTTEKCQRMDVHSSSDDDTTMQNSGQPECTGTDENEENSGNEDVIGDHQPNDKENIEYDSDSDVTSVSSDSTIPDEGSSEEEDLEEQINGPDDDLPPDPPLYTGARVTLRESMLMILMLFVTHNLTQSCLADVIECTNFYCLEQGFKKNSLFKFKKYFHLKDLSYTKHHYCSNCLHELCSSDKNCSGCKEQKGVSYFLELNFIEQLKEFYKRNGFYESLQHRSQRQIPSNGVADIYDGMLYKKLVANGFLANRNNISFSWYTDGIPVYKSSKIGMWPIYLSINELPFKNRTQKENVMLAGLWFGDKKPAGNHFLTKLRPQFQNLAEGIDIVLPRGKRIAVQGINLFGTCDLPAKSEFMNMTQYNGCYGCANCLCPGQTHLLPSGGSTHVYPYTENLVLRTSEATEQAGIDALNSGAAVMGVKGPSVLSKLMPDFIRGMGIDRMHGFDSGVIKKLLNLWFCTKFRTCPFSLVSLINVVNEKLQAIRPPKFVHRLPRSIDDILHWKASELKMWAFYYSLPVLSGLMREDYFQHYCILITAVSLLSRDIVTHDMIRTAKDLLHQFVRDFEQLYGVQYSSMNVHQLLHLPECVENMGPLWCYTCYPFEDLNGKFLKLVHGTRHIDSQVAHSHFRFIIMKRHVDYLDDGAVKQFCLRNKNQVKICEKIHSSCYSVGTYSKILEELPRPVNEAIRRSRVPAGRVQTYQRLLRHGKLFVAETYVRDTQTLSCYVNYLQNNREQIGVIHNFIKITPECHCLGSCTCEPQHYAVVQKFTSRRTFGALMDDNSYKQLPHIYFCRRGDQIVAVPIDALLSVSVYMSIDDNSYIGVPINSHELE